MKQELTVKIEPLDDKINPPAPNQRDIFGMYLTVTTIPTLQPTSAIDQIQIYVDSLTAPSVIRLYAYVTGLNAWHYTNLT